MKREHDIEINDAVIVRYLAGEAMPEEAMALHTWIGLAQENRIYFETLKLTWSKTNPSHKNYFTDDKAAWLKVQPAAPSKKTVMPGGFRHYWRIAASVIIILAAGISTYLVLRPGNEIEQVEVSTSDGLQQVDFSDQSRAVLYHQTVISYPRIFNPSRREIVLQKGEAYFKIQPNARAPFVIHTEVADIRVVGTAFNVRMTDSTLEVSVKEGKVLLGAANDSTNLVAGQTGTIKIDEMGTNSRIEVNNSVRENTWAYATHQLSFKNTPLPVVISDIEKAYGYVIKITNPSLSNCKLTATFDIDSGENLLNLIAEPLNLSVRVNDKVFYLEGEGCP